MMCGTLLTGTLKILFDYPVCMVCANMQDQISSFCLKTTYYDILLRLKTSYLTLLSANIVLLFKSRSERKRKNK